MAASAKPSAVQPVDLLSGYFAEREKEREKKRKSEREREQSKFLNLRTVAVIN